MDGMDLDRMPVKYWDEHVKISYLQRRIIIYSIMYYKMNGSCIPDKQYDAICNQLVHLQNSVDINEFKMSQYYYAMYDFDGTTGFDLPDRLNEKDQIYLTNIAEYILKCYRSDGEIKYGL